MKLYCVTWTLNPALAKGKGRCGDPVTGYTILSNNRDEALRCLRWHWHMHYPHCKEFDIEDGDIKISRCKIDSRGFSPNYLLLDSMKVPIELNSIASSLMSISFADPKPY